MLDEQEGRRSTSEASSTLAGTARRERRSRYPLYAVACATLVATALAGSAAWSVIQGDRPPRPPAPKQCGTLLEVLRVQLANENWLHQQASTPYLRRAWARLDVEKIGRTGRFTGEDLEAYRAIKRRIAALGEQYPKTPEEINPPPETGPRWATPEEQLEAALEN